MTTDEARRLAEGDPYSFLHVVRAEIDLDPTVDPYDARVYAKARENLQAMIERGWLVRDEQPAYYVYRLDVGDHSQTGIVGASAVEDYQEGRIKRHEHTRPAKENDRVRLVQELSAHPGPVFLVHRDSPDLDTVVRGVTSESPDVDFAAADGVRHRLWVVGDPRQRSEIERRFEAMPASYVADGHHRAAAAARVAAEAGAEPGRHFLTVLFPADQVRVMDYNRVVRDLAGSTPETLLRRIGEAFHVEPGHADRRPPGRGRFGMYLDGSWYLLTARDTIVSSDLLRGLDVSILAEHLLQPLLEIDDPRTDPRIDFVGGIRGMDELERRVESGAAAVAFALYPTSLDEVMQVADAGEVMPPKSTWFEPKLRSGMVVQQTDGDRL